MTDLMIMQSVDFSQLKTWNMDVNNLTHLVELILPKLIWWSEMNYLPEIISSDATVQNITSVLGSYTVGFWYSR